ncbi:MAG: hypothetical protein K6B46_03390 [Opitutales bacterium]|nr:hypothetical protein [Opitutales bacterium]
MLSPTVKNLKIDGDSLDCDCVLAQNDLCFEGHFPDFKLLPGVTQLHFVAQIAREHLGVPATFSKMSQLKFKSFVRPGQTIHLSLKKSPTSLAFTVSCDETLCAQGQFVA